MAWCSDLIPNGAWVGCVEANLAMLAKQREPTEMAVSIILTIGQHRQFRISISHQSRISICTPSFRTKNILCLHVSLFSSLSQILSDWYFHLYLFCSTTAFFFFFLLNFLAVSVFIGRIENFRYHK